MKLMRSFVLRLKCITKWRRKPKVYHERNIDIARLSGCLIATPLNESRRGGTWDTIQIAARMGKRVFVVKRDGSLTLL